MKRADRQSTEESVSAQNRIAPIIRTKLYRPPAADDILCRGELHRRLDEGWNLPLTLVAAACGKSTLVSHWLKTDGGTGAWISLDETEIGKAG